MQAEIEGSLKNPKAPSHKFDNDLVLVACSIMAIYKKTFFFAVISIGLSLGYGQNAAILKDTETSVGATVTLYCSSSIANIEWHHLAVERSVHEIVYQDGYIFNGYKERFSVNRKDNGEYNLEIRNVKTTDAGKYTCVEKSKNTEQRSAELIVFEQYPSNKSCAAKFTCNPVCGALEMTCSMKAHGNIIPLMEWRESIKGILTSNSDNVNGITVSAIHVDLQRGNSEIHSYTCRVKYPLDSSLTSQFSWSYLVSVPDLLAPTSSDEKLQDHSDNIGFTVVIVLLAAACVAIVVLSVILFLKNKRNKRKIAELRSKKVGNTLTESEGKNLLEPEDEEDDKDSKGRFSLRTPQNKNKSIFGIGVLNDEIFLVTRDSCIMEVFDLNNAKFKRAWEVKDLINPCDLATCPLKSLVFICDWKKTGRLSEIISCDKNGDDNGRWTCENERGRISITNETNVIVAENFFNSINEYKQDGKHVDKIRTKKLHLEHAIKLENRNFIASFGDGQDDIRGICVIDSQGNTVSSIDQDSFKQFHVTLSAPRSLAVDKNGCIYVCDLYNGRIILMTPELKYKEKIEHGKNKERFRGPLRLYIHESVKKRQLLVADSLKKGRDWKDGRIYALDISPISSPTMKQTC